MMGWEILALTTAVLYGLLNIVFRQIAKELNNVMFNWIFNAISSIFFLLLFVRDFSFPNSLFPWLLVVLAGFLWVVVNLIWFEANKYTEVSLSAPLSKLSLPLIFILSLAILNETISLSKVIGILFIFGGVVVLTWEKGFSRKMSHKGVRLTILTAIIFSAVAIVDKIAVQYFTPAMYGFLMFLIPAVIITPLAAKNFSAARKLLRKKFLVVSAVLLGVMGYFFQLTAYTMTEISNVIPIIELAVLISVIGGYLFHKEKELKKRFLGAIIMIIGSIFILRPGLL